MDHTQRKSLEVSVMFVFVLIKATNCDNEITRECVNKNRAYPDKSAVHSHNYAQSESVLFVRRTILF